MKKPQRYFTIGSEWLYFKLYMGSKTSERFLTIEFRDLVDELIKNRIIDKWFFINYNDPNRHIRIRLRLTNVEKHLFNVINKTNNIINPLIKERLLTDVIIGTYKREIERYGLYTINEFESLFFYNSELIINVLKLCEDNPEKRWLYGIKTIDFILNDWEMDLISKRNLFESLKNSFGHEMGVNKNINKQLSAKFRENRSKINSILEIENEELLPYLLEHRNNIRPLVKKIKQKEAEKSLSEDLVDILKSYIHMHYNRLFSSKQRMNEWVIYYFLHQYYRSKVARGNNNLKGS